MRRSKAETAESRRQILEQAAGLFRERGPERVSVADVMEAAGMTHGGFYKHFSSKEALFAAAIETAFAERLGHLAQLSSPDGVAGVRGYLGHYLTLGHVESLARGCPIAGLAMDAERMSSEVKSAMSEGASSLLDRFSTALGDDAAAIRALTSAIGAIVLARAVDHEATQRRILDVAISSNKEVLKLSS
ncbi:MAG: TetR/AcrR family transcriptional regulator [Rhizobiales bacterium]|nr:TetR/AcrR family transcriptional regulator [Hyphomicrobiales bacterium]